MRDAVAGAWIWVAGTLVVLLAVVLAPRWYPPQAWWAPWHFGAGVMVGASGAVVWAALRRRGE